MYVRLALIGTGEEGDGYRVDLPSYNMVSVDYANMASVVSIGPRDQPPTLPVKGSPLYPDEGGMFVLIGLDPQGLASWWARLASRYPGRDVAYQPTFP